MDNTQDSKKQQVKKMLDNEVSKYTKDGSSLPQAISLTCKKLGLNPYNIVSKYFPEIKPDDLNSYKDIKTDEGSFVTIKGDSSQTQYEVININNKDAIVLRNTNNNQEITASEDEITPVITENKMDKLNEAQYSVSINGLETTDAAALSQMLSSAAQAEQSNGAVTDPMSINPEPMDMTTGMPMDMGAELPAPSLDMPMDSTLPTETLPAEDSVEDVPTIEDDIEFDEELPTDETISLDTDANAYANPEMDTAVVPTDSLEDGEKLTVDDESAEPVENPEELEPANDFGGEESIEDMSMDDMMDDGMYEGFDYDALIKEALEAAGISEAEETIPESEDVEELDESEDDGSMNGSQEEYAEEISEAFGGETDLGVEFSFMYQGNPQEIVNLMGGGEVRKDTSAPNGNGYEYWSGKIKATPAEIQKIIDVLNKMKELGYDSRYGSIRIHKDGKEERIRDFLNDIQGVKTVLMGTDNVKNETSFDDEIAEALRIAGVELDEAFGGETDLGIEFNFTCSNNPEKIIEMIGGGMINEDNSMSDGNGYEYYSEKLTATPQTIDRIIKTFEKMPSMGMKSNGGTLRIHINGEEKRIPNFLNNLDEVKSALMMKNYEDLNEEIIDSEIGGNDSFDDEIAETLRIAGVELDEAEATMPTPVDEKTLYANKEAKKNEDLAPEYHEVDTTPFSKESSEGFKMTLESAVKVDKVKKIYETAKSMYAKKDIADWMTLDRRYITKLIKEGVGYEKANKILTAAKKGK